MTTVKSRFDANLLPLTDMEDNMVDTPWLTTYSRALCSLYPKDEDDCFDLLLSTQCSNISTDQQESTSSPQSCQNNDTGHQLHHHHHHHRHHHTHHPTTNDTQDETQHPDVSIGATLSSSYPRESSPRLDVETNSDINGPVRLSPTSPGGTLSHAFCSLGFDCIDYFTATQDDQTMNSSCSPTRPNESLRCSSATSDIPSMHCSTASDHIMEANTSILEDQGVTSDWAAAVCGKRTAALERKRILSRISSQENDISCTDHDPWFETLDRLSRWDEVAYR